MKTGDKVRFNLYGQVIIGIITARAGSPSEPYQFFVTADDGRDFVAKTSELEVIE